MVGICQPNMCHLNFTSFSWCADFARIAYGPWRLCLLTDLGEISNLNRGPSIDASYQISVDLAKGFHRKLISKKIFSSETT
jgi:hypothetical protein